MQNTIDPENGNITWEGDLQITKGDHSNMPARTDAYLPGDERGHVTASSLGGDNSAANVTAQSSDLNHGAYSSMEQGERTALQNGAEIHSEKTAVVNGTPGDRPQAFMVSDTVTYPNGHTETIHNSFTNASSAEQEAWNSASAALPGAMDMPNPGDALRDSMSSAEYAELMESTDAELPGIAADYAPSDFSGLPGAETTADAPEAGADTDDQNGADANPGGGSDGIDADPDD